MKLRFVLNALIATPIFGALLLLTSIESAWALPELVRYGYNNCTSCHYSPSGGGVLTPYGREFSENTLSMFDANGSFLFGAIKPPNWLALQGDFSSLNLVQTDPVTGTATPSHIYMQEDLEAALVFKHFTIDGTIGRQDSAPAPQNNELLNRRFYVDYKPTERFSLRAGKFLRNYGINFSDHEIAVKQDLGFDQGSETYNVEGAWLGEHLSLFVTGVFGRPDDPSLNAESGAVINASYFFGGSNRVGFSYAYGTNNLADRNVFGPYFALGFTKHLSLLSEFDFQRNFASTFVVPEWGLADYQRLDYEILQGLHLYTVQNFSQFDFSNPSVRDEGYGFGIQYFPIAHIETRLVWERRRMTSVSADYGNWYYFDFHFYP
jgi:hypothetical protein